MTQDMAYALSKLALQWHWVDMSVGILIGFDCVLRTGELLQLRVADIMMNDQLTFATINLPDTKSGKCTGITDSVSVTEAALIRLLARFMTKQPGDSIVERASSFSQMPSTTRRRAFSQQLASKTLQCETKQCHKPFPSHKFIG